MKQNVAKEVRLLWPAWSVALLLAVIPVWLIPSDSSPPPPGFSVIPLLLGAVLLGLSPFGRELSLNTFPLLLAQPAERLRSWQTKVSVLAVAILSTFVAWLVSNLFRVQFRSEALVESLVVATVGMIVAFTGGFWTTLLLRQVAAAFWFSLLIPTAIFVTMFALGEYWLTVIALGAYSVASFLYGRRLFLRIQEAAWTGGVISLPAFRSETQAESTAARAFRPVAALCSKEFQLYHVSFIGMACLLILHLVIVVLRKIGHDSFGLWTYSALEAFGGIWVIIPVLCASMSIAEERKLGTMDHLLCLPLRRGVQFTIKLLFALFFAGFLGAAFFFVAEGFGMLIGVRSSFYGTLSAFTLDETVVVLTIFLAFAFVGFCASTLARNSLQAFFLSISLIFGLWAVAAALYVPNWKQGVPPWGGVLVFYVGLPPLVITFLWLAWKNFRRTSVGWSLWRRNLLGFFACLCFVSVATATIYNRAWEFLRPIEPAHGPARLTVASPQSLFHVPFSKSAAVQLPGGRVWLNLSVYELGKLGFSLGGDSGFRFGGHWITLSTTKPIPGSNWVQVIPEPRELLGIRADGSLWVSEKPGQPWDSHFVNATPEPPAGMTRYGQESDWRNALRHPSWPWIAVLLKQEGTLWMIGTNTFSQKYPWPGLRAFAPLRADVGSNWVSMVVGSMHIYAWKKDGTAWGLRLRESDTLDRQNDMRTRYGLGPGKPVNSSAKVAEPSGLLTAERIPAFDNRQWKSIARALLTEAAVLGDGTLWAWHADPWEDRRFQRAFSPQPFQIGHDHDWVSVASDWASFAALKSDGSIWKWSMNSRSTPSEVATELNSPPVPLSRHKDWVALGSGAGGVISLSADGGFWFWNLRGYPSYAQPMLVNSRRPVLLGNAFSE